MPSRKRSNLSRTSRSAKRLVEWRSQQSEEDRDARMRADRENHAQSRQSETFSEREVRLIADNLRHAQSRESETFTEREERLTADSLRHAQSRESETFTEREERLTADSLRHAQSRESETFTEREERLTADSLRHAQSRESETFTEREERLTADSLRHAQSRESETFTEREERLTADSLRHAQSRESETLTEREERLTADSLRHAQSRESETFTEREERLTADSLRHAQSRESETFTEREERLTADSLRHAQSRESETFTEREERLTADSLRHAQSRESETFTEREERLTADSLRHAQSRESETFTEREERLTADSVRHAQSRESETFTLREQRLNADSLRHALTRESESFTYRELRLTADRTNHAFRRAEENETDRNIRLGSLRQYYEQTRVSQDLFSSLESERIGAIRQEESSNQRSVRMSTDRLRHSVASFQPDEDQNNSIHHWSDKEKSAFAYSPFIDYAAFSNIGRIDETVCVHCHAYKYRNESKGLCCSAGKIFISTFQEPPEPLKSLLSGNGSDSNHFLSDIRAYNSAFQMTSFGAKQIVEGPFMPTFKIQGQVYHLIGSILPVTEPKFLQIYFVSDYNQQTITRNSIFPNLHYSLLTELQTMLHQQNPYVVNFKSALDSVPQSQLENYKFVISAERRPFAEQRGRYNAPTTDEVAVVLVDQECDKRDIVLRMRDDSLQRISETHRAYDALQYPLIHCRGEDGYNFAVYQVDPTTREPNFSKKISAMQFYRYLLQIRRDSYVYLQRFRGLFNQYLVDMYAKIETERLIYIRTNQEKLRAENYVDLRDALQQDTSTENLGRLVILPSSFTGGPRYMHERTQDAMCYVRKYGRPDLFITFTTNPKWDEIKQGLLDGQASHDRHDIIARVFHLKLKLLINLFTKEKVFGTTLCYMCSIEWQKRGLPHAHILLWLQDKIRPNDVDNLISAEFPNPNEDPMLYDIVKSHMVHGPCGTLNNNSPCMQDGQCTKKYPKVMVQETITGEDGYPSYRRRSPSQGGFTTNVRLRGQDITIDNRWVVPHSPVLSKTFKTHINVEVCSSVQAIKYICKYINKGSDQATLALRNERDEVTRFQTGRYISTSEAVWRILSFPIHERHPPVVHLDIHVEGGQRVYFQPNDDLGQLLENPRKTTLLAYFALCERDDFAKTLLYDEVPSFYTFDKQQGVFNRRKRGTAVEGVPGVFREHVIGRVYTVHPNNAECFYIRLLLHTVRGPTGFSALKIVDEVEYPTFQAACRARHLLDDDQHWDDALNEACVSESPHRLRHLFAIMLVFCGLTDATQLWQKYKLKLAEDFARNYHNNDGNLHNINHERIMNQCLTVIQDIVTAIGGNLLPQYGLPAPIIEGEPINREYATERNYDATELSETLESGVLSFTLEQRSIFERVCQNIDEERGELLFLDAPGGTGKTFLTKVILAHVRMQGKIALAVASSGIAATLLPGGKTAHTMFKIPINLDRNENPVCDITRNSDKARVVRDCSLIIWDECTMAHRKAVEAVDRTLRDLTYRDQPMGGIPIIFSGDFRQTLPVVTKGTRADEVRACLKSSYLWPFVTSVHLTKNMRVLTDANPNAALFSDLLLQIGDGRYPEEEGNIRLSNNVCKVVHTIEALISSVYCDLAQLTRRDNYWICERAILTPRNDQAVRINETILSSITSECMTYSSIDRVVDQGDAANYPIEFLNSLSAPGLPAHTIKLKIGVPIMLLRNISPPKLCNGTRLKVTSLQRNLLEAEILTGCGAGEQVLIPRIPLIPHNFPFQFRRTQFPVSVCYAMTINKSQGQTLRVAGVDLGVSSCFSHGQLYVACSRVSSADNIFLNLSSVDTTVNVVYREAL